MSFEKNIEDLFQSEDLEKVETKPGEPSREKVPEGSVKAELPKLDLPPVLESEGIDRREFTRIDVQEHRISVRFHNEMQFAKHYIENLSVGGLFVRTKDKYEMGALVPIEFEVKTSEFGDPELFQLKGKVCRVINDGVGLEFTNLDQVTRTRLESYVQSILPRGANVRTKARQSTIEKLEQMRQSRAENAKVARSYAVKVAIMIILCLTNGYLIKERLNLAESEKVQADQSIEVNGRKLKWSEIRSLEQTKKNLTVIHTLNESFEIATDEIEFQLPPHLQHQFQILKSTPPQKVLRRSKNAGRLTDVRDRKELRR